MTRAAKAMPRREIGGKNCYCQDQEQETTSGTTEEK